MDERPELQETHVVSGTVRNWRLGDRGRETTNNSHEEWVSSLFRGSLVISHLYHLVHVLSASCTSLIKFKEGMAITGHISLRFYCSPVRKKGKPNLEELR